MANNSPNEKPVDPRYAQAINQANMILCDAFMHTSVFAELKKEVIEELMVEYEKGQQKVATLTQRINDGLVGHNQPLRIRQPDNN